MPAATRTQYRQGAWVDVECAVGVGDWSISSAGRDTWIGIRVLCCRMPAPPLAHTTHILYSCYFRAFLPRYKKRVFLSTRRYVWPTISTAGTRGGQPSERSTTISTRAIMIGEVPVLLWPGGQEYCGECVVKRVATCIEACNYKHDRRLRASHCWSPGFTPTAATSGWVRCF